MCAHTPWRQGRRGLRRISFDRLWVCGCPRRALLPVTRRHMSATWHARMCQFACSAAAGGLAEGNPVCVLCHSVFVHMHVRVCVVINVSVCVHVCSCVCTGP